MMNAPIWVTLLIASSDDNLNAKEIQKSKEVIKVRTYADKNDVENLYKELMTDYERRVQDQLNDLPLKSDERLMELVRRLEEVNKILEKLEHTYAVQYYQSLKKLALSVAQSDGGLWGLGSISEKEARYLELPMIKKP